MVINNNTNGIKIEPYKLQVKIDNQEFIEEVLKILSPIKIIKRFIYKPFLDHCFPYIDIASEYQATQLSFFFDKININFSEKIYCSRCKMEINNNQSMKELPIALCSKCFHEIHYGYWDCINNILEINILKKEEFKNLSKTCLCKNLYFSECGYPKESELINPCLKNHGIGIIIEKANRIKIIISSFELIKYKMIFNGGLFGIILGYHNKIMNIEMLEHVYRKIISILFNKIEIILSTSSNKKSYRELEIIKTKNNTHEDLTNFSLLLLIQFLLYYNRFPIRQLINRILENPFNQLKKIVNTIYSKFEDLEVLEFIELYKYTSPFTISFRDFIKDQLYEIDIVKNIIDIVDDLRKSSILDNNPYDIFKMVNLDFYNDLKLDLDYLIINEIYFAGSKYLIVKLSGYRNPVIIPLNELIGRKILNLKIKK